jgi:hypothetical protein
VYIESSREFIKVAGEEECQELVIDQNRTVISLMSTDDDGGDCLYRMIISMASSCCYLLLSSLCIFCRSSIITQS